MKDDSRNLGPISFKILTCFGCLNIGINCPMFSFAGLETKSVIDLETHEMSNFVNYRRHQATLPCHESNRIEVPQLEQGVLPALF